MIILTGGTGFIGQWLLRRYAASESFLVLCMEGEPLEGLFTSDSIEYARTDFSVADMSNHIKRENARALVHLAALRPAAGSPPEAVIPYLENIALSERAFLAALEAGLGNVVNISSRSVYNEQNPLPWTEDMPLNPRSGYAIAKLTAEHTANALNHARGMHIKSLRFAQALGLGEKSALMISIFLKRALAGQMLSVYGKGIGKREYIYVKDMADAIMLAADKPDAEGVFNIGTGENHTNEQLARTVNAAFENAAGYELLTDKPEDTSINLMDCSKAEHVLGFKAQFSLQSALEDMRRDIEAGVFRFI